MGCVFITGVGVAGTIPETDVDYFFLKHHMEFLYGKFQTYAKVGRIINTPPLTWQADLKTIKSWLILFHLSSTHSLLSISLPSGIA